jgi:hypothetical protein
LNKEHNGKWKVHAKKKQKTMEMDMKCSLTTYYALATYLALLQGRPSHLQLGNRRCTIIRSKVE